VATRARARLSKIGLPDHRHHWPEPRRTFNLQDRTDRARAYVLVLREGAPSDLLDYIDGTLLVDIWDDLDLPDPIRRAWQPLIQQTRGADPRRTNRARGRGRQ